MSPSTFGLSKSSHSASFDNFGSENFKVYDDRLEHVAQAVDGLFNAVGELQYLVIEFIAWEPGKQVLIPLHLIQASSLVEGLYIPSLNRQQVLETPAYRRNSQIHPDLSRRIGMLDTESRSLKQITNSPVSPTRPPTEVTQEEVIPLREERLVVNRKKQKVGEIIVRKEIEIEMIQVPIQREKLIIEQVGSEPKKLAEINLADHQTSGSK